MLPAPKQLSVERLMVGLTGGSYWQTIYMLLKCDIISNLSNMLLNQIDHLLFVAMATRLFFLCTVAMFVGTVEPEERSHAY